MKGLSWGRVWFSILWPVTVPTMLGVLGLPPPAVVGLSWFAVAGGWAALALGEARNPPTGMAS